MKGNFVIKYLVTLFLSLFGVLCVLNVFIPSVTDWAIVVPQGIACDGCRSPEIQHALAAAAKSGRDPFLRGMEIASYWLFTSFVLNLIFIIYLIEKNKNTKSSNLE